ncbi:MAG: hypothetical protein JWR44_364 [Hymenobacter sp.]|jgi:hypothetical protein|nr:hypothetical protein [Hymenobacter sp.]
MAFPLQFILENLLSYAVMGKGKKKHKHDDVSEDILDVAALSVRKFRKVTKEISKLSTGQKLVGGIALVAAGLAYLAKLEDDDSGTVADAVRAHVPKQLGGSSKEPAGDEEDAPAKPSKAPRKSRKTPKAE